MSLCWLAKDACCTSVKINQSSPSSSSSPSTRKSAPKRITESCHSGFNKMRVTRLLSSGGGGPIGKYGKYLGGWGNFGSPVRQRGIIQYGISPNRQKLFDFSFMVHNGFRRLRSNILYFIPMPIMYYIHHWANERNEYLNSKAGRAEFASDEE